MIKRTPNKLSLLIRLTYIAVSMAGVLLTGCASIRQIVPVATGNIATNSARIAVSRGDEFFQGGALFVITDNGSEIGRIGPGGRLVWDRTAGPMELKALFDGVGFGSSAPLQVNVGAGMEYEFMVSVFTRPNYLSLVSGLPVGPGTNTTAGITEQGQPSSERVGVGQTIVGTITSFPHGPRFKSGPPLWPFGFVSVATDSGATGNYLVVGSGTNATIFYDADGKVLGNIASGDAKVEVGKKVEIRYVAAPANYVIKALAVSVRYMN